MSEQWAVVWSPVEIPESVCRLFDSKDEAVEFVRTKLAATGNYERAQVARVVRETPS